jgi:hypothetical protein
VSEARLRLLAHDGALWAILDACDAPEVPARLRLLPPERGGCLWSGEAREKHWGVAPWLAKVDVPLLDWVRATLWAEPWGLFVEARATADVLRKHLRRQLIAQDGSGKRMYFRFYDPRVLRTYLRTATPSERADLFGPAESFWGVYGEAGAREVVGFPRGGPS